MLEQKVYRLAESILAGGLDISLQTMLNDTTIDDSMHILYGKLTVLRWSAFFEDAVSIGKNVSEGIGNDLLMPSTARTMFIDALLDQLKKLSDDHDSELKKLKFRVLQASISDLVKSMETTASESIPLIKKSFEIQHTAASPRRRSDQREIVGMSDKIIQAFNIGRGEMIVESHRTTKPYEVPIGWVKYRGRYEVVNLRFYGGESSDTFYVCQQVVKPVDGNEQIIQQLRYRKVTDRDQLNHLTNSPYLQANIFHESSSWVDSHACRTNLMVSAQNSLPSLGLSDLYLLEDDPPTIYDPKIISFRRI